MEKLLTQRVVNLIVNLMNKILLYLINNGLWNGWRPDGFDDFRLGNGFSNTIASPSPLRGGVFGIGRFIISGGETGINKGGQQGQYRFYKTKHCFCILTTVLLFLLCRPQAQSAHRCCIQGYNGPCTSCAVQHWTFPFLLAAV